MKFLYKLKETILAILPLVAIVSILCGVLAWTGANQMPSRSLTDFYIACAFVVLGQVVFLIGIDNSLNTMGEMTGAASVGFKKLPLVFLTVFIFGFLITIADPDIVVLSELVERVMPGSGGFFPLTIVVALGVGIYSVLAFVKVTLRVKFKYIIIASYALIFILAFLLEALGKGGYIALAFDSGGVITGPITVPFILALGIGAASVRSNTSSEDSFGTVALAAIGPIVGILILGLFTKSGADLSSINYPNEQFSSVLAATIGDVLIGVVPIALVFLIFQAIFIKLPKKKVLSILFGVALVFVGLVLFLTGINYGFSAAGYFVGNLVAHTDYAWILIPVGATIGIATVYTEPAIAVLGEQVENVTSGNIKKSTLKLSLAAGVGLAVALAVIKIMFAISFWWFIVPAIILAAGMMFFTPEVFTAIAFDSGGVASGPVTATFTLPLLIGIAAAQGRSILLFAFGLVFLVSIMPPIIIQGLGIINREKEKQLEKRERAALRKKVRSGESIGLAEFRRFAENDFDFSGLDKGKWKATSKAQFVRTRTSIKGEKPNVGK